MKKEKNQKLNKTQNKAMKDKNKNLMELYNKGKAHYIWKHGVLSWGVSTGVLFIILTNLFQHGFAFREIINSFFTRASFITLGLFGVAGFIWGSIMWRVMTKQIEKINFKKKK